MNTHYQGLSLWGRLEAIHLHLQGDWRTKEIFVSHGLHQVEGASTSLAFQGLEFASCTLIICKSYEH